MTLTVDPSNYLNIQKGIFDLVVNHSGLTFYGSKRGEVPQPTDLAAPGVGFPFFAIRQGVLQCFATNTELNSGGDAGEMGVQITEPVWDFDCYIMYKYSVDQDNFDVAANSLITAVQFITENKQLPYQGINTCVYSNAHSWAITRVTLEDNSAYTVAKFTVRAYEMLNVSSL